MNTSLFLLLSMVLIGSILAIVTICTRLDESPRVPPRVERVVSDHDLLPH